MLPEKKYKARIMKKLAKKSSGMGHCRFWMRTNCYSRIAEFGEPIKNEHAIQMFAFCNCLGQQGAMGQNFTSNASYPVAVCFGSAITLWITNNTISYFCPVEKTQTAEGTERRLPPCLPAGSQYRMGLWAANKDKIILWHAGSSLSAAQTQIPRPSCAVLPL